MTITSQTALLRYLQTRQTDHRLQNATHCGQELTKQHILFECKIMLRKINKATIGKYSINIKRWNEKTILGNMFQQVDKHSNKINWQKFRTQIGIIYKIWVNFTAIQYGGKTNQAILTNYQDDLIEYVTESNHIYLVKKKKKKKKIIIETNLVDKNDKPLFQNEHYAILLKKKQNAKRRKKN